MSTFSHAGYRIIQTMIPLAGAGTPVQAPSYAGTDRYAISTDTLTGENTIILNSTAGEAHAISESMLEILGKGAPGIFVDTTHNLDELIDKAISDKDIATVANAGVNKASFREAVKRELENLNLSTWTASHRHADAAIRYSIDPATGKQIWAENSPLGKLIRAAGNGMTLAENFPNSAILGYWLSARNPQPTRTARSVTSRIVGYGASEVKTGATRHDILGSIPVEATLGFKNGEVSFNGTAKGTKPSARGFGFIPGDVTTTAFRCSEIKREATVSTRALAAHLNVTDEMHRTLEALALLATIKAGEKGIYRSGTDLIVTNTVIERILTTGAIEEISVDEIVTEAHTILEAGKHLFANPLTAHISEIIVKLIVSRMTDAAADNEK